MNLPVDHPRHPDYAAYDAQCHEDHRRESGFDLRDHTDAEDRFTTWAPVESDGGLEEIFGKVHPEAGLWIQLQDDASSVALFYFDGVELHELGAARLPPHSHTRLRSLEERRDDR